MENDREFDDIFNVEANTTTTETETSHVDQTTVEETQVVEQTTDETTDTNMQEQSTEPAPQAPPRMVPLDVLTATRREEAAKRAQLEQRLKEFEEQKRQANRPDPFENLDEYDADVDRRIEARVQAEITKRQQAAYQANFDRSYQTAASEMGPEAVQAALDWAEQVALVNESWGQQVLESPDPIRAILNEQTRLAQLQKQQAEFEEYMRNPQDFLARKAAELGTVATTATTQTAQAANRITAPRSLASVGSGPAAKPNVQTEKEEFDRLFDSKR